MTSRSRRLNDRFPVLSLFAFYWPRATFRGSYVDTFAAYWQPGAARIIGIIVVGISRRGLLMATGQRALRFLLRLLFPVAGVPGGPEIA